MWRALRLFLVPCVLLAGTVAARELWLEPSTLAVKPGTTLPLRIFTGENFQGTRWSGKASRIAQLLHRTPSGLHDLTPTASTSTDTLRTSSLHFQLPGTHVVALATSNAYTSLSAAQFAAYAQTEGFGWALAQRKQQGESEKPVREAYRRCATTLVQVGEPTPTDTARAWARPTGLALEILPEQNPYFLNSGMSITLRILADGLPVTGQLVRVWQRGAAPTRPPLELHSNQNGRVLLRLMSPGQYLASTVRLVPSPDRQQADWQSTWSTFTFAFQGKK